MTSSDLGHSTCDCRPGMDGHGVYHEWDCASRRASATGSDSTRPSLTDDEQGAFDAILDAMHRIQNLNGRRLRANGEELAQAVHVLQGFVIQSACGRLGLFGCSDGWWEPAGAQIQKDEPKETP